VLHPNASLNAPYVDDWLGRCEAYLAEGYTVYFMMHCPNNQHCPAFAEDFHRQLQARVPAVGTLPAWPLPRQDSLF